MKQRSEKKGFLLIGVLIALVALTMLSTAIFSRSVQGNAMVKRNLRKLTAVYNAEMGYECAYYELTFHGSDWVTHLLDPERLPSDPYLLHNMADVQAGYDLDVILQDVAEYDATAGTYQSKTGDFFVKVYQDPADDQFIILSRGISDNGNATYLLVNKVAAASLYSHFWFTPETIFPWWTTFQANGGKIHTNKNIIIADGNKFLDIAELSAAGHIAYHQQTFLPPPGAKRYDSDGNEVSGAPPWEEIIYWMRDPWQTPMNLDENQYFNKADGVVSGMERGLYMENPDYDNKVPAGEGNEMYVPCQGTEAGTFANKCYLPQLNEELAAGHLKKNSDLYKYIDYPIYGEELAVWEERRGFCRIKPLNVAEEVVIPNLFEGLENEWDWDLYHESSGGRWSPVGTVYYPNPDDPPVTIEVNTFHTVKQRAAWEFFRDTNNLLEVVKDKNSGAHHISPLKINAQTYFNKALALGMYIAPDKSCTDNALAIRSTTKSGTKIICPKGGKYEFNGVEVAAIDTFIDVNSLLEKEVIKLDLEKINSSYANIWPENGLIYSEENIALTNASFLEDPLTTVSYKNAYLVGNYNSSGYQPSAVISPERVYTLSENFFANTHAAEAAAPGGLPTTLNNPNYPYELNGYDPANPEEPYWDGDGDPNTDWQDEAPEATRVPAVDQDYNYNVSIIGWAAYPPHVLERWCPDPEGQQGSCYSRNVRGAFINLPEDNFDWQEAPNSSWPNLDWDKARTCAYIDENYPGAPCRASQYPGWPSPYLTGILPVGDANSFEYEDTYDVTDPATLPPGELPGFFDTILLAVPDTEHAFTYHLPEYSPVVPSGG
ncbi:hypothetical protein ACFL1E_01150 [Candidatus Omnitrophota bacterium]